MSNSTTNQIGFNYFYSFFDQLTRKLNANVMNSTDIIAGKIDDIAHSASGECSLDKQSKPFNIFVGQDRLKFMSTLREKRPDAFRHLVDFSQKPNVLSSNPQETKAVVRKFAMLIGHAQSVYIK